MKAINSGEDPNEGEEADDCDHPVSSENSHLGGEEEDKPLIEKAFEETKNSQVSATLPAPPSLIVSQLDATSLTALQSINTDMSQIAHTRSTVQNSAVQPTFHPQVSAFAEPVKVTDEAIESAQKHARWAVSALDYSDTTTAILELQKALADLNCLHPAG